MVRPISASSGTPPFWQRAWALLPIALFFESIWCKLKNNSKCNETAKDPHARRQKGGVPEEAEICRTITTFVFFTCAQGAPMTDSPHDAVSAAKPLCTHGNIIMLGMPLRGRQPSTRWPPRVCKFSKIIVVAAVLCHYFAHCYCRQHCFWPFL